VTVVGIIVSACFFGFTSRYEIVQCQEDLIEMRGPLVPIELLDATGR